MLTNGLINAAAQQHGKKIVEAAGLHLEITVHERLAETQIAVGEDLREETRPVDSDLEFNSSITALLTGQYFLSSDAEADNGADQCGIQRLEECAARIGQQSME